MRVQVNDSIQQLAIENESIRNERRNMIMNIVYDTIKANKDYFDVTVYNTDGKHRSTYVGNIKDDLIIMLNSSDGRADDGSPNVRSQIFANEQFWDVLKPLGNGILFRDFDGEVVAEYIDKTPNGNPMAMLNILFDVVSSGKWDTFKKILIDFNNVVIRNLDNTTSWKETEDKKKLVELISKQIEAQKIREINETKSIIENRERDIENYKRYIVDSVSKVRNSFIKLKALEETIGSDNEKIITDLNLIAKSDKVKDLIIRDDKVIIYTNVLYIYDENNTKYYGGEYEVEITLNTSDVRFRNRKEGRKSFWSKNDPHPHISGENGRACWGNLSSTIAELCSQNELYAITLQCIDFLENVDIHEWAGGHIANWDKVDEDGNRIEPEELYTGDDDDEDRFYCEGCDEHYSYDEERAAYSYINIINDGEDFEYGDMVSICEGCYDNETYFVDGAEEYALEVNNIYEESDEWKKCLHCEEVHHIDEMIEVLYDIEVDKEQGIVTGYGDHYGYVCEDSCADYYDSFYDEVEGTTYFADEIIYKETEEDYNERIQG